MRLVLLFTAAAALGVVDIATAQQRSPADFRPLEFLVGSCWVGTFPDGKKTDEHCFEWVFDQQFIRDRHIVRGGEPYQGETIYGWDPVAKQLSFWYWNSHGEILVGRLEYTPEGIVFPTQYTTAKGTTELKAVWSKVGNDAYRVAQNERVGSEWKSLWSMELKKKPK